MAARYLTQGSDAVVPHGFVLGLSVFWRVECVPSLLVQSGAAVLGALLYHSVDSGEPGGPSPCSY